MAGQRNRSGGANALSIEEHKARGSFRADRHDHLKPAPSRREASLTDRRRVFEGFPPPARRLAAQWFERYQGWTPALVELLRAYVLSCARLEALQRTPNDDTRALHKEVRTNLALLRELQQGAARCR